MQELKLSDSYEKQTDDPKLQLKCMVYNINSGKNRAILEKCSWLNEYMIFVNKVREYHTGRTDEELIIDIELAIDYCVEHDILKEFLLTHRSEVTKNMQLDYTFDRQIELEREDAREEGREEGIAHGSKETSRLINQLNSQLLADDRIEDLKKSTMDKEYQEKLLKQYGLIN